MVFFSSFAFTMSKKPQEFKAMSQNNSGAAGSSLEKLITNLKPSMSSVKSFDFSDVDNIILYIEDHGVKPNTESYVQISKKDEIDKIHKFLEKFPKKGEMLKSMIARKEMHILGLKDNKLKAYAKFYDNYLQAPDTAFYGFFDKDLKKAQEDLQRYLESFY
jgi:hypothetical protein